MFKIREPRVVSAQGVQARCATTIAAESELQLQMAPDGALKQQLPGVCDRYTVLRDGTSVGTGYMAEAQLADIIRLMVGRDIQDIYPRLPHTIGETLLEFRQLAGRPKPRSASLRLRAGEILGIAGLVSMKGYDGLIYSVGWLVGWPIIMFLISEPLRNLGKYTFADVVSYRLNQRPIRAAAAAGSLVVVITYLIAQMVGAGTLIKLMFGITFEVAIVITGSLSM